MNFDLEKAIQTSTQLVTAIGMLAGALSPILIPIIPTLTARWKNRQLAEAVNAVSNACLHAMTEASAEMRKALDKAREINSPGGIEIIEEEREAALAIGIACGIEMLRRNKVLSLAINVYGGEEAVKKAFREFILQKQEKLFTATVPATGKTPSPTMVPAPV